MAHRKIQQGRIAQRTGGHAIPSNVLVPATPADVLAAAKVKMGKQLIEACDAYERRFFSGGIHAHMLERKLAGSQKAVRNQQWILALWREYYRRLDALEAALSLDDVDTTSLDFTSFGHPPHSAREILAEIPVV